MTSTSLPKVEYYLSLLPSLPTKPIAAHTTLPYIDKRLISGGIEPREVLNIVRLLIFVTIIFCFLTKDGDSGYRTLVAAVQ